MKLRKAVCKATADALLWFWGEHEVPTRRSIVSRILVKQPELQDPRLDLEVATHLEHLVIRGIVQRKVGKVYLPGDKYLEPAHAGTAAIEVVEEAGG